MTTLELQKKIAPILPKGKAPLQSFIKEALLLKLQEVNQKIAVFEGKYNKNFREFGIEWQKMKIAKRSRYDIEGDYLDWEALEEHKRDFVRTIHSL